MSFEREDKQMQKPTLITGSIVAVAMAMGWYFFRPELIFINETVNETLPGSATSTSRVVVSRVRWAELSGRGAQHGRCLDH
jgi:hypothetical protein